MSLNKTRMFKIITGSVLIFAMTVCSSFYCFQRADAASADWSVYHYPGGGNGETQ